MILVDSSAWVEFFRASGHPADLKLCKLMAAETPDIATAAPIRMEVLRGVRDEERHAQVRVWMEALPSYATSEAAFSRAGDLYRALRKRGVTVRSSMDCLIVAIAEEHGLQLLHVDRDFNPLVELTGIALVPLGG